MKNSVLLFGMFLFLTLHNTAQTTVTDRDGNVYHTVAIGTQVWLLENLKTTKYRDGTDIQNVTDDLAWGGLNNGTGGYCDYENNASNSTDYGRLYNWFAVTSTHNLCPAGWHVPSDAEWSTLTDYLGGESVAGGRLKEIGSQHWAIPNNGATNQAGFTALPGGNRGSDGTFNSLGDYGWWWTSTEDYTGAANAWTRFIGSPFGGIFSYNIGKANGYSIRCIQDTQTVFDGIKADKVDFRIFPNPASDKISVSGTPESSFTIQIFTMLGECVVKHEMTGNSNMLNISDVAKGVYIIKITGPGWSAQQKLIKE